MALALNSPRKKKKKKKKTLLKPRLQRCRSLRRQSLCHEDSPLNSWWQFVYKANTFHIYSSSRYKVITLWKPLVFLVYSLPLNFLLEGARCEMIIAEEIVTVTRVQVEDMSISISQNANTLGKGIHPAMGK